MAHPLSSPRAWYFPWQAPAPTKGKEEIINLHISIQGDSLDVSKKKKVMLRALEPGIFIQTDKAVYKPGQQGEGGRMDHPVWAEGPGGRGAQEAQPCSYTARKQEGSSWDALGPPALAQGNARTRWQRWRLCCWGGSAPLRGSGWISIHLPHGEPPIPADAPTTHSCIPICSFQ